MADTIGVVIPYGGGDDHRLQALARVLAYYRHLGLRVSIAASAGEPFNKSRALNRTIKHPATADILVLNDADSLVPWAQIDQAIELARRAPGLVYAFDSYRRLSQHTTEWLKSWRGAFTAEWEWEQSPCDSHGCVVIRREDYLTAGGYDERFEGWGREDHEFGERVERLWPGRRVAGPLVHLWHPPAAANPENEALYVEIREGRA